MNGVPELQLIHLDASVTNGRCNLVNNRVTNSPGQRGTGKPPILQTHAPIFSWNLSRKRISRGSSSLSSIFRSCLEFFSKIRSDTSVDRSTYSRSWAGFTLNFQSSQRITFLNPFSVHLCPVLLNFSIFSSLARRKFVCLVLRMRWESIRHRLNNRTFPPINQVSLSCWFVRYCTFETQLSPFVHISVFVLRWTRTVHWEERNFFTMGNLDVQLHGGGQRDFEHGPFE